MTRSNYGRLAFVAGKILESEKRDSQRNEFTFLEDKGVLWLLKLIHSSANNLSMLV